MLRNKSNIKVTMIKIQTPKAVELQTVGEVIDTQKKSFAFRAKYLKRTPKFLLLRVVRRVQIQFRVRWLINLLNEQTKLPFYASSQVTKQANKGLNDFFWRLIERGNEQCLKV